MPANATLSILQAARAQRPELASTLDLHIAILEARGEFKILNSEFDITPAAAQARLGRGEPLLRADELALDWDVLARLFQSICEIATTQPPLLSFLLNNALHPFLSAYARGLGKYADAASRYRAYCPVCGGEADFAALEKESGARRLLCARCDFEWTFQRAVCPFCSVEGKLNYFSSDDGAYRLYVCESCKRYLKTIDLRELAREVNLPAERVLTIQMDAAAREAGYA